MDQAKANYVIVGGGLYGSGLAYHLARNGAKGVVLLERSNSLCPTNAGTSKSCAIVRTHYSIEKNLEHAVESLHVFENFNKAVGGESGFVRTGYLVLGPEDHREPMERVFAKQNALGVDTKVLTAAEAQAIHPWVNCEGAPVLGYDSLAGYCDPTKVVFSYAGQAEAHGVTIRTNCEVTGIDVGGRIKTVTTSSGTIETENIILAIGPWTSALTAPLGLKLPYEISRHKVVTFAASEPYRMDWPIVKDLTNDSKLYFRPYEGGKLLLGTGDHGDPIEDPNVGTEGDVDEPHINKMRTLVSNRMPQFANSDCRAAWTGPYDITPDWNPIIGDVPGYEGLWLALGFSGHGFKLAPTLSEGLALTILGKTPKLSVTEYHLERFEKQALLHGAYGIGSIS